jgi:hypothetical protein
LYVKTNNTRPSDNKMSQPKKIIIRRPKLDDVPLILKQMTAETHRGWTMERERLINQLTVVEKYDFVRRMVLPDTILTKENKTWLRENSKVIERIYVNNNYKVPSSYETEAGNRFRAGEQLTEKMNILRKEYKQTIGQI